MHFQINIKPSQTADKEIPQMDFDMYDFEVDIHVDLPSGFDSFSIAYAVLMQCSRRKNDLLQIFSKNYVISSVRKRYLL